MRVKLLFIGLSLTVLAVPVAGGLCAPAVETAGCPMMPGSEGMPCPSDVQAAMDCCAAAPASSTPVELRLAPSGLATVAAPAEAGPGLVEVQRRAEPIRIAGAPPHDLFTLHRSLLI